MATAKKRKLDITSIYSININGVIWDVEWTDSDIKGDNGRFDNMGVCDTKAAKISISDDLADEKKLRVLLHECCHAYLEPFGVAGGVITEEQFCELFSLSVIQLLRDNPDITEFIYR